MRHPGCSRTLRLRLPQLLLVPVLVFAMVLSATPVGSAAGPGVRPTIEAATLPALGDKPHGSGTAETVPGSGRVRPPPSAPVAQGGPAGGELCDTSGVSQFSDVPPGDYGSAYILCMRALGLSVGMGGGRFGPDETLTRGQMASFLVRLWRDVLGRSCPGGGTPFTDVVGSVHEDNIACIYNLGITVGTTTTTYSPGDKLTVSQTSRFLLRTYKKAGNRCPSRSSELDEAVDCLFDLNVIPDTEQGKSSVEVSRSQMAVYVIGLWHNLSGRGLPPYPPGASRDGLKPIPEELAREANVVTTGRMELPVYICARAGRYTIAHLRSVTDSLNQKVASFFREQSSGQADLHFVTGGIVSPDLDWSGTTFPTLYRYSGDDPCTTAAEQQEGHRQLVIVVDVRKPTSLWGYAWTGLGPAVQPMEQHFSRPTNYYATVAHEVGHSRFGFCHTHQTYGSRSACPLYQYHNANVYNLYDNSLMSYSGNTDIDSTHIACAHREQAGWLPGPPLPDGQRCTPSGGGPGQDDPIPGPPQNLTAIPGDGQLVIRWSPPEPPPGERWQWLTGYTVSFESDHGDSGRRTVSDTRTIIAGLTNGVEYTVEVTANNSVGSSRPARTTGTPVGSVSTPPGQPSDLSVISGDTELTVHWSAPTDDGGSPITGYAITADDGSTTTSGAVGPRTRSYRITGLTNNVEYTIEVRANNRVGFSRPRVTRGTPTPAATAPGPPTNVRVDEGDRQLTVHWSAPTGDGGSPVTAYVVTHSNGREGAVTTVGSDARSYRIGGLANDVRYTVWVHARNRHGDGPTSAPVSAFPTGVTLPPERPHVTAVATGDRIDASWWAADNGAPIDRWEIGGVGEVIAGVTSYTWQNVSPGTYQVRVRAQNAGGWSPWGSASVTVTADPTVTISKGDMGPTSGPAVGDAPCAANDSSCRWINLAVDGFPRGRYTGRCVHQGFRWPNGNISAGGWWREFTIDVGSDGKATLTTPCYVTFSALRGNGAHIAVDLDGRWIDSNTLAPDTNFVLLNRGGPGPTTAPRPGSLPCAANAPDCRWLRIELRNFTPGRYRVYCAHDGWNNGQYPAGYWHNFETTIGTNGGVTITNACYVNIPSTDGRGVRIHVGHAGQPTGQYQWSSNWLR